MTDRAIECDVLIIGTGMAGSCLARQIRLREPDLKIINLDKRTQFSYWIGESTVEAWEDYVSRYLGLREFLDARFPVKNGLRMFFDSADKNLSVSEMSEFGRAVEHAIPGTSTARSSIGTCASSTVPPASTSVSACPSRRSAVSGLTPSTATRWRPIRASSAAAG
jgi:hypothetical protein